MSHSHFHSDKSKLTTCKIEIFLLYGLEFTYAAALHLVMTNALFPQALDGQAYLEEAHWILDEMISNGNKVAEVRKAEYILKCYLRS